MLLNLGDAVLAEAGMLAVALTVAVDQIVLLLRTLDLDEVAGRRDYSVEAVAFGAMLGVDMGFACRLDGSFVAVAKLGVVSVVACLIGLLEGGGMVLCCVRGATDWQKAWHGFGRIGFCGGANDLLTDRLTDWYECVLYTEIWHATLLELGCVMLDVNQAPDGDRRLYLCTLYFTLRILMCILPFEA